MYPSPFSYHRASSVQDAIATLAANPDAKLLAGGHSLVPAMKLRLVELPLLVDIGGIAELRGIRREGDRIAIGALTTHRTIEFSDELKTSCPILPEAAAQIGDPQVRNMGTIGGSLAHADPAADFPAVVLALGATMTIQSESGTRTVDAEGFFTGMFETVVGPGEMLTTVTVPVRTAGTGMAYEKFPHPASRYAIAGVAAVVRAEGGACRQARVAVTGAVAPARRLTALEQALFGKKLDEATLAQACRNLVSADDTLGDAFASSAYRAHLVDVLARRALARAAARAA
ncbi:MAG TPA: xanthine dehydrogenase family protein subunit M [Vicinamibacterales bacterium]